MYFAANFLGSSAVKYIFLVIVVLNFLIIFTKDWKHSVEAIIMFSFIEGQGRVVWGYNPFFRIVFDLLVILATSKNFISHKKLYRSEIIPSYLKYFIFFHFLWYLLLLFNPIGVPFYYSILTAKYYIAPILLFFSFTLSYKDINDEFIASIIKTIVIFSSVQVILSIFQMYHKEDFMYSISGYYKNLFTKFEVFTGQAYRPWGTTHMPGAPSVYLFLSVGVIFLTKSKKISSKIFKVIYVACSWFALLLLQVRSAWMKHIAIVAFSLGFYFLTQKNRAANIIKFLVIISVITFAIFNNFQLYQKYAFGLDLEGSIDRIKQIDSIDKMSKKRSGVSTIFSVGVKNFRLLGFGLGLGGGVNLKAFKDEQNRLRVNENIHFWSFDNFFLFSFQELGLGAFFYIGIYFFTIIYLITIVIKSFKCKYKSSIISAVSLVVCFVLFIGAWGAVSLCFNPDSFYFWMWASLGIASFFNEKLKLEKNII